MEPAVVTTKDTTANPAPLGLLGFGMTTVLLNLHNAGFYPLDTMILAMGIFYGGIAQIIAGVLEWRKGNTFGTTAFVSYGSFWLTLVALVVMPKMGLQAPTPLAMAAYLFMWGLFTGGMFIGTLKLSNILRFVFLSLTVLFFLLAAGRYQEGLGNAEMAKTLATVAGYEGIVCGLSAIYAALAGVLNELYKRTVLPVG
jgi:succinate-acetate transporter protein